MWATPSGASRSRNDTVAGDAHLYTIRALGGRTPTCGPRARHVGSTSDGVVSPGWEFSCDSLVLAIDHRHPCLHSTAPTDRAGTKPLKRAFNCSCTDRLRFSRACCSTSTRYLLRRGRCSSDQIPGVLPSVRLPSVLHALSLSSRYFFSRSRDRNSGHRARGGRWCDSLRGHRRPRANRDHRRYRLRNNIRAAYYRHYFYHCCYCCIQSVLLYPLLSYVRPNPKRSAPRIHTLMFCPLCAGNPLVARRLLLAVR